MKIFRAEQIKELDVETQQREPISSTNLMERAAWACFQALKPLLNKEEKILVFCGMGNNGGDGLSLTRLLNENGYQASALLIRHSENASSDHQINYRRLRNTFPKNILEIHQNKDLESIPKRHHTLFIDALLGTGINKKPEGLLAEVIDYINSFSTFTCSIDVPSGLFCDESSASEGSIVKADLVLSFQFPKLAFLLAENADYVKNFQLLDIQLHPDAIARLSTPFHYISRDLITALLKHRSKFSHKGSFGHGLLLAGSRGKSGAALIAAKACLKSGAGLLTVHSTKATVNALLQQLPEAMSIGDTNPDHISEIEKPEKYSAIAFGPGVGMQEDTQRVLKKILQYHSGSLVIDADGLNILAENKTWLTFLPPNTLLTPHVKEFDRLTRQHTSDFERLDSLRKFTARFRCIVILKSAHTAIAMPDGTVFFNSTGNPGLAKAGSGDGLTGLLLGLLCRTYTPAQAALIGVYLHGLSADQCAKKMSQESMLISDVINEFSSAFLELEADSKI